MNRTIFTGVLDGIVMDRIVRDDSYSMPTMHFHPEYEIYYLLDGSRYYFIENKTYPISKGSLVLIPSMQIHKTSAYGKSLHDRMLIELTAEPFSGFFEQLCGLTVQEFFQQNAGIIELDEVGQERVERILFEIVDEFEHRPAHYRGVVMMELAELLIFVSRYNADHRAQATTPMSNASKHKRIHDITAYILEHFDEVKSLEEISRRFYISKSYLCRIFKEVTGFTVQEYINMRCIQKAQELLENSAMSVSEISAALGYGSVTHFERMFKKYTETTPLKYRKKIHLIRQKVRERKAEKNLS